MNNDVLEIKKHGDAFQNDEGRTSVKPEELPLWHLGGGEVRRRPNDDLRRVKTPEDHLFAALLRMVLDHCARPDGTLDSFRRAANREAMQMLADAGYIRIDDVDVERVRATVMPEAEAFLARMEQRETL